MTVLPKGPNRTLTITLSLNTDTQDLTLKQIDEWLVDLIRKDLDDDECVVDIEWGPEEGVSYE